MTLRFDYGDDGLENWGEGLKNFKFDDDDDKLGTPRTSLKTLMSDNMH